MEVKTIPGGKHAFNAIVYSTPDPNTLAWMNNTINHAKEVLGGVADYIVDTATNLYNTVNSSTIINAAKALVSQYGGSINEHAIYALNYENMGTANYMMQQYIMASPYVQTLYHDNMCYGFEETYYNPEPTLVGEDRSDYQRVMDGVVQEGEDGLFIQYFSNTDEVEISDPEKFAILETWDQVKAMIQAGIDPTHPEGAEL